MFVMSNVVKKQILIENHKVLKFDAKWNNTKHTKINSVATIESIQTKKKLYVIVKLSKDIQHTYNGLQTAFDRRSK